MDKWAVVIISIVVIISSILLLYNKPKNTNVAPDIPPATEDMFKTISLTPKQSEPVNNQQQVSPQPTVSNENNNKATYSATIKTTKGDIVLSLRADAAPNTVKNFINKAKSGFYNNLIFHRVEDWVIQGGDPNGDGTGGGQMPTELNQLPFVAGSIGVARRDDIRVSNDSQFFITKTDSSWLNGQYTNFGTVIKGMDVVSSIKVGDKILGISVE